MSSTGYLGILSGDVHTRIGAVLVDGVAIPTVIGNVPQLEPTRTCAVVTVVPSDHRKQSMGSPARYRAVGDVLVELYVPMGGGEDQVQKMADEITRAFLDVSTIVSQHSIRYKPAPTFSGLAVREDAHWRRSMRIPFQVDYYQ